MSDEMSHIVPSARAVQPQSELGSPTQIVAEGKLALERQTSSANWKDGVAIMRALDVGRARSMHEAECNKPRGYKYCKIMGTWLRVHGFDIIDKGERKRFLECFDHLDEIDAWREGRSPEEKFKLNYPPTVLKAWRADLRKSAGEQTAAPDPGGASDESEKPETGKLDLTVFSDAEVTEALVTFTLTSFLRVMPPDWRLKMENVAERQALSRLVQQHGNKRLGDLKERNLKKDSHLALAVDNTATTDAPTKH
jgi:hypothetical protein